MPPLQSSSHTKWQAFASLEWFDAILDFVFKLTAKSSEVLLAAGVILSTANHFQHGSLFTATVIQNGKPILADTVLFQVWTWTQALGFEASAGVVLASALDAHQYRDLVKRNVLLTLMAGLAFVGTIMLVMAFVEAATGIKEQDPPVTYGITMSVLRGIVSVAYVTVGRVKNRCFSGPDVVSVTTVPDLLTQIAALSEQIQQMRTNSEQRMQQAEVNIERYMQQLAEHVNEQTGNQQGRIHRLSEQFGTFAETIHRSLNALTFLLEEGKPDEKNAQQSAALITKLEDCLSVVETLPDLTVSLGQIEEITASQLRVIVEEVVQDKMMQLEQYRIQPKLVEQLRSERALVETGGHHLLFLPPSIRRLPRAANETATALQLHL